MQVRHILLGFVVGGALSFASAVRATEVYYDSFAVNNAGGDTARDPGDPLAGTTTEVGSETWLGTADYLLGQIGATTDGYVYSTNATSISTYTSLPLTLNPNDVATIEARVKPFNSGGLDCWIALGFANGAGPLNVNGTTWMLLRPDTTRTDEVVIFGSLGGTSTSNQLLKTAMPGSPDADGYFNVQLTYNASANTVSVTVNDTPLLTDVEDLGTPTISNVGFHFFRTTTEGALDDFRVTVTSSLHPGDANGDGMVNLADLQILGDNWQSTTATWAEADFTGDANVNLADLQILGDNWGFGTSPDLSLDQALQQAGIAIPEPASLAMLGIGSLLLVRRRTLG